MTSEARWVVFTDLDGTLLDHHSYSFEPALPALHQLQQRNIPVVLNSSKTRPEMEALQRELDIVDPFIVENGAALVIPAGSQHLANQDDQIIHFAPPREELLAVLNQLRNTGFGFKSFNDFSVAELAQDTGLSLERAAMAKQRLATEPFQWQDSDEALEAFKLKLEQERLHLVRGGRFYHLMGQFDKADAMKYLIDLYQQVEPTTHWRSIALGDSLNDEKMLAAADYAVIIKGVNSHLLQLEKSNLIRSERPGPEGWNDSINQLLTAAMP